MRKTLLVWVVLVAPCASAAFAAPNVRVFGQTRQPLLYVIFAESTDFGAHIQKGQAYVFRDGTVVSATLSERWNSASPEGGSLYLGTVPLSGLRELNTSLGAAQAGKLSDCTLDPPDLPLDWFFTFRWFGAGARTNSFRASQDVDGPICPAEVESLIDAVHAVLLAASRSPTTQLTVP